MESKSTEIMHKEEFTDLPVNDGNALVTYTNASMLKIADEEQKKLQTPVDENLIEIRPDGLLYLPQAFVRDILNQVFGIGQWALIQHQIKKDPERNKIYFDGSMLIRGSFVSRAMGEAEYHADNPMQSWASVYESAKSDCLVRCCKDLGIAKELWMPAYGRAWQKKYAIKVWREKTGKSKNGNIGSFQWRRKDVDKFYDEKGASISNESTDQHYDDVVTAQKQSLSESLPQTQSQGASFNQFDPRNEIMNFGKKHNGLKWIEVPDSYLEWMSESASGENKEKAIATLAFKKQANAQISDPLDIPFGKKYDPSQLTPIERLQDSLDKASRQGTIEALEGWAAIFKPDIDKLSEIEKTEMRKAYNAAKKLLKGK